MFKKNFSHFLSYGASDQFTARELRGKYDGLIIPGTVAAYQRAGTGGFVLALSASESHTPYVIDPRSPLFQQVLVEPKKSHEALRTLLGLPSAHVPDPRTFSPQLVVGMADSWVAFNSEYQSSGRAKFDKYARRLGDKLPIPEEAQGPELVLAPYFVATTVSDPWWQLSRQLLEATRGAIAKRGLSLECVEVVAADTAEGLGDLLRECGRSQSVAIWVSGLDEARTADAELVAYGSALASGRALGHSMFALYGGFFAVLLSSVGLCGVAHGIGYGEYRNWRELPQSGPPPARYYLPELHRYVSAELADVLWGSQVTRCSCPMCGDTPPILLEYHDLMMHSVHCRAQEVNDWVGMTPATAAERLEHEFAAFNVRLERARIAEAPFKEETRRRSEHIARWCAALRKLPG